MHTHIIFLSAMIGFVSLGATDLVTEHAAAYADLSNHLAHITLANEHSSSTDSDDSSSSSYYNHWDTNTHTGGSCSGQANTDEGRIAVVSLATAGYTAVALAQPTWKAKKASTQAAESLERYAKAWAKLQSTRQLQALGAGFGIGILSAIYNRVCGIDVENKLSWLVTAAATLGVLAYQNHADSIKNPVGLCIDAKLKPEKMFSATSRFTFVRAVGSLFAASLGYFGTDYVLKNIVGVSQDQSAKSNTDEDAWLLEDGECAYML